jgi:hypothetical protein
MKPHNSNSVFFYGDMRNNAICWDDKQVDFYPQVKILNLNNEFNYSIRLNEEMTFGNKHQFKADGIELGRDSKAFLENKNVKNECYTGSDLFEWFIYIKRKPLTNKIYFSINTKDVRWDYQGILTPEEIARGGNRPDDIQGSFALYCPKQNHIIGGTNYMAGKVGHVPAPYVVLLDGTKIKCQMTIDNGLLVIEIPLEIYLNWNWEIPLLLDPTLGYTTAGGSHFWGEGGVYYGIYATPASSGSMTSISFYGQTYNKSLFYILGIYEGSTLRGQTAESSISSTLGWRTANLQSAYNITGSTQYTLVEHFSTGDYPFIYYDNVEGLVTPFYSRGSYSATLDASVTFETTMFYKYSIYGTYTESGGTSNIKKRDTVAVAAVGKDKTVAIANIKKDDTVANS